MRDENIGGMVAFALGMIMLGALTGGWAINSGWEKAAAKRGYGYFNENKDFVWK
jgi:hypothetical protein